LKRKPVSVDDFEGFSIRVNNIYTSRKQLDWFKKAFDEPNNINSFAFVASFPVICQCLVQSNIPSPLLGLIHISSEFSVENPHNWLLPSDIEVNIKHVNKTDKGLVYEVETLIYQMDYLTIQNTNVMLDKDRSYKPDNKVTSNKAEDLAINKALSSTGIGLKTALKYAWLSKDLNPIHLHPVFARAFGLKTALIHGMFNAHYCLGELSKRDLLKNTDNVKFEFNRPCFMPNQVFLRPYENSSNYGLFSKDKSERFLKIEVN